MSFYSEAEHQLQHLDDDDLLRLQRVVQTPQGAEIDVADKHLINFSSNDYLGLANNSTIKGWFKEALDVYGIGAGASQLIVGHSLAHDELEQSVCDWLKRDAALIFSSGYLANLAIASTFIDKSTLVIQDKLNHASLIDAAVLSRGRLMRYPHLDISALEKILKDSHTKKKVVMTDGVFSMDGDVALLQDMADLCSKHDAMLIVDDAHGLGAIGNTGGGLLESLQLTQKQVPLLIGTFGKSLGAGGAFVSGDERLIQLMLQKARTYIYTTAMLPAMAATLSKTIALVKDASHLRQQLQSNVSQLKQALPLLTSDTHIQPLIVGSAADALSFAARLEERGLLAMPIRPPTVPNNSARIRISLSAAHTSAHVLQLAESIKLVQAS